MCGTCVSIYTEGQYQYCEDTSDTTLIEIYVVTLEYGCNPFRSASIPQWNEISIANVIAALMLMLSLNGP